MFNLPPLKGNTHHAAYLPVLLCGEVAYNCASILHTAAQRSIPSTINFCAENGGLLLAWLIQFGGMHYYVLHILSSDSWRDI